MRTPEFWAHRSFCSTVLLPAASLYGWAGRIERARHIPYRAPVPVLCIGNLVAGGAGKTPLALALFQELTARFRQPHFLTRGYGGREAGPLLVDPARHTAGDVGDEALLLAQTGPSWVARDRVRGADAAAGAGADLIVMDDGFQNPSLIKDLSLLVIDGSFGFGNGFLIPAGPLREAPPDGLARADGVVLIGPDLHAVATALEALPVARATLAPEAAGAAAAMWAGRRVIAFAGIGRPRKFFETLRSLGAELVETVGFADHHPYRRRELERLFKRAVASDAVLVTTSKDGVRLPAEYRDRVEILPVRLVWQGVEDRALIGTLLDRLAERR